MFLVGFEVRPTSDVTLLVILSGASFYLDSFSRSRFILDLGNGVTVVVAIPEMSDLS